MPGAMKISFRIRIALKIAITILYKEILSILNISRVKYKTLALTFFQTWKIQYSLIIWKIYKYQ